MSYITLEQLAENATWICLDANLFSRDKDYAQTTREKEQKIVTGDCFAVKLGAAKRFSDIKLSALYRQAKHSARLLNLIKNQVDIQAVPKVLDEYKCLINHIERSLDYFLGKTKARTGKKERSLRDIRDNHQKIYSFLRKRKIDSFGADEISSFLIEKMMHKPTERIFNKKNIKQETNPADAEIISYALLEALGYESRIAIISNDFDLPNILKNFIKAYEDEKLPSHLRYMDLQGTINIYFMDKENWTKEFGLRLAYDSSGYHW